LIKEAAKPRDPSLLSFDQSALKCHNDRLSLDYDQAHKYLGVILKSAVLAKLSEQSSKALNAQLSADAAAIAQLVLNEIGLKVEGDSQITRDGEIVTTKGDFKLSLVPFQDESAELQERDAKESISMSFVRVAGEGNDGSFSATISASELDANKQVRTYEMKVAVSREKAQGKMLYKSSMSVGHKGSDPHLKRMLVIEEIEAKKYRVLDEVSSGDVTKQSAFMIDIKALSECVIQKDKVKDDDKDKLKDKDQPKGDEPKKDEPKNDDKKDEPKKPVPVSDDDDVHTINKPGQNPGQSPTQK
jgi:hypothetical protein